MFSIIRAAPLIFGLALAGQATGQAVDQAALKRIGERGHQMFLLDEAAWVSTDEMLRKLPDPGKAGVRGWIVEPQGDHLRSTYYGDKKGQPVAVFVADTRGKTIVGSHLVQSNNEAKLTPLQLRMVAALNVVRRQPIASCTPGRPNTIVIPPQAVDEPIDVYVLSVQAKADEYPFGGHRLFHIDQNGSVVAQRDFTKACLNMSRAPSAEGRPVSLFVTHLLDPTPTEIHVFTSEAAGLPVLVGTPIALPADPKKFRVWKVEGPSITMVQDIQR